MSVEENKALVRRFYDEVLNAGKVQLIDELFAPDYVEREQFPGLPPDREGLKQFFTVIRAAFPDLSMDVDDMIAEGDKVATRYTMKGTHKGEFMGMAATGKQITVTGMEIIRFRNGKLVEHWGSTDQLGMMQQLGVIPA